MHGGFGFACLVHQSSVREEMRSGVGEVLPEET